MILALSVTLVFMLTVIGAEALAQKSNSRKAHRALVKSVAHEARTRGDMGGGRLRKNSTH